MADCAHENFEASVSVGRLTATEGGPVDGFKAEVRIVCAQCRVPFRWLGLGMGDSPLEPLTSVDGLELRAPITPEGTTMIANMPGFRINPRGPGRPPSVQ